MFWSVTWYCAFIADIQLAVGLIKGVSFEPAHTLAVRTSEARKMFVGVVPSGFVTWKGKSRAVPCTISIAMDMVSIRRG